MLRDLIVSSCFLVCLGLTFRQPFAGVLAWAWIALMQPNMEVYGFITPHLRMNLTIAVVTIVAWLQSKDRKLPPADSSIIAVLMFLAWMTFNEFFAVDPGVSWGMWDRIWRVIALGLILWATANSKSRIHALVWVIVACFLYFGVKSGVVAVSTGGIRQNMGPNGGMYADNNQFAAALIMVLPLIAYLRAQAENRFVRIGLATGFVLTVFAIVASYSRGAFIGLAALGLVWWFRSRNKFLYLLVAPAIALSALSFMPPAYYERLGTIDNAEQDSSFHGRVVSWKEAYYIAKDHFPLGVGTDGPEQASVYNHYFPDEPARAAHSFFFQVLGDLGFGGLAIYLLILFLIFRYCSRVRRETRSIPEFAWARDLATAIQLSMTGFCFAASGLSMAYSDFVFIWAGVLPRLLGLIQEANRQNESSSRHIPGSKLAIGSVGQRGGAAAAARRSTPAPV